MPFGILASNSSRIFAFCLGQILPFPLLSETPTNCLSVFDHFERLVLKGLITRVCVCVNVCSFYILHYPPCVGVERASSECKFTKLIVRIGCPLYHLTSWRKLALIQKSLAQIPRVFHQEQMKSQQKEVFRYKCFNRANCIAYLYWK